MGPNITIQIDIVAFSDLTRVNAFAQAKFHFRRICKYKRKRKQELKRQPWSFWLAIIVHINKSQARLDFGVKSRRVLICSRHAFWSLVSPELISLVAKFVSLISCSGVLSTPTWLQRDHKVIPYFARFLATILKDQSLTPVFILTLGSCFLFPVCISRALSTCSNWREGGGNPPSWMLDGIT